MAESKHHDHAHPGHGHDMLPGAGARAGITVKDPVCGMSVDPGKTAHHADHGGQSYHFCSAGCRQKSLADPDEYSSPSAETTKPRQPVSTIWTCPMHPQIREPGPGSCPICGMAVEPEAPTLDNTPNPELVDFTRRLWVAGVLAVPLLILSMGGEMLGVHLVPPFWSPWIQLVLCAPIALWAGLPFFERGGASLKSRHTNMFTLISLGVGAAFLYSLVATVASDLFPAALHQHGGMVPVYYEAAGVVVALVLLGQVLELRARAATGRARRCPSTALCWTDALRSMNPCSPVSLRRS